MKHRLLYAISVLPALLVMPAMAKDVSLNGQTTIENQTNNVASNQDAAGLTIGYGDVFVDSDVNNVNFTNNKSVNSGGAMKALNGFTAGDGWTFTGNHSDKISGGLYVLIPNKGGENRDVVFGKNAKFENNDSKWLGGALGIEAANTVKFGSGATFTGNSSKADGGAIAVWTDGTNTSVTTGSTLTLDGATFTGNNATKRGGAIANLNNDTEKTAYNNTVNVSSSTFSGNSANYGGAIYNEGTLNVDNGIFETNESKNASGGAVYNTGSLTVTGGSFVQNVAQNSGGAVTNAGTLVVDGTNFSGNNVLSSPQATTGGGALYNTGDAEIKNAVFSQNVSLANGGAINNADNATLSLVNTNFTGNYKNDTHKLYAGGAISNGGSITKIDGGTFLNNHVDGASSYGGAIYVHDDGAISEISGTKFVGNYSLYHGGALATIDKAEITLIKNAYFEGNGVKDYGTEDAVAVTQYGGAFKHGGNHETEIQNSTFINNMATLRGGAIINETSALVKINNNSVFTSNKAKQSGGALYGNFEISDSKFSLNSAVMSGGAMSGYGKISNTMFKNNFAGQEAGALVVSSGEMELNNVTFDTNYVDDTYFANGVADWQRGGGAIYSQSTLKIDDSTFDGNYAGGMGGAISNWWGGAAKLTATNTDFKNNYSSYGYGGAIFNSETITELTTDSGNVFSNNTAVAGGAIANMSRYNDAKGKSVTIDSIDGYTFENNHAIANDKALIRVAEGSDAGKFENASDELRGHIDGMGGAIYNEKVITSMSNVTFTGNTATDFGGAIYNSDVASITMSGTNVFADNTANGVANDIHNDGTLTIVAGETTLDGGITGNGVFTLADGATLNLGTANITQLTLNLNGTLNATINSATDYAQLFGDATFGDTSVFNLTVGSVGTYKMFSSVTGDIAINAGDLFDAVSTDEGIVVTTKSAAEIAENTGMSEDTANMLNNVTNATSDALAAISIAAQQELMAGNVEYVAAEMEKLNPEDKPVVQAVATTVQNEVLNLVASRMATLTGRAGGDVALTGGGVWAQGLFNKSKYNGVFHGYTRGVSAGIDEVIEHDYTIGLGYAYGSTDIHENKGRSTDITSNTLFLYAQYKPAEWFINAVAHYTTAEYKESATVIGYSKASAHDVDSFGGSVTAGYSFASGATPELGLRYLNITQDDYVDSFGTKVSADTIQTLTSVAGVKYVFDIDVTDSWMVRPELRAAATYDIISDKAVSTVVMPGAASYIVDADRLSRVGGEFGVGLATTYYGLELSVNYDLNVHKDYTSQTGMVRARYEF